MSIIRLYLYLIIILSFTGSNFYAIDYQGLNVSLFRLVTILLPLISIFAIKDRNYEFFYHKHFLKCYLMRLFYPRYISFLLIWGVYALCSILWVSSLYYWFIANYFILIGILCVVTFNLSFKNIKHILICIYIVWILCWVHSCVGWVEVISGKYYFLHNIKDIMVYQTNMMPVSSFGNTNDFATCMLVGIFISIGLMHRYKSKLSRLFMLFNIINMFALIILSSSRANIIGFALGICFLRLIYDNASIFRNFFIICLGCVVVFTISYIGYPTLLTNIEELWKAIISSNEMPSSINIRKNLILNGMVFLRETYFMGVGAGNSSYYMLTKNIFPTWGILNMHNWWLEILIDYGVIIFCGYVHFYIRMICDNIKIYRVLNITDKYSVRGIAFSFVGFLIAYSFASISSSSNLSNEFIWIVFALILSFLNVYYRCDYMKN